MYICILYCIDIYIYIVMLFLEVALLFKIHLCQVMDSFSFFIISHYIILILHFACVLRFRKFLLFCYVDALINRNIEATFSSYSLLIDTLCKFVANTFFLDFSDHFWNKLITLMLLVYSGLSQRSVFQ